MLPLLKGAHGASKYGELEITEDSKLFQRCTVDDSDGCSKTDFALMQLESEFESPAAAMPSYVKGLVTAGKLAPSTEARVACLWGKWFQGCSWHGLAGESVSALEINEVMMRSIAPKNELGPNQLLCILRYNFQHIEHEDFLESLGFKNMFAGFSKEQINEMNTGFKNRFVCIWKATGVLDCEALDVPEAIKQAEERTQAFDQLSLNLLQMDTKKGAKKKRKKNK